MKLIRSLFNRAQFAWKYKTLSSIKVASKNLHLCHQGREYKIPHQCPHQGAEMINGFMEGDVWVCPWHGCRYDLKEQKFSPQKSLL